MSYNRTAYFNQQAGPAPSSSPAPSSPFGGSPFARGGGSGGRPRGSGRGGHRPRSVFEHSGSNGYDTAGRQDTTMETDTTGIHSILEGYLHCATIQPEQETRFVKWLTHKMQQRITIKQTRREGTLLLLQLANFSQACQATRCDGYLFENNKVSIKCPPPVLPPDQAAFLAEFLSSRYDAAANILDLSGIPRVPELQQRGIRHFSKANAWLLLSQVGVHCPQVASISFESNEMRSAMPIGCLVDYVPNIQNISLKNNDITSADQLEAITSLKAVREIMLSGNPIRQQAEKRRALEQYKREIVKRFPTMEYLDGEEMASVRKTIPASELMGAKERLSINGLRPSRGWFDQASSQSVVDEFVTRFWKLYDEDRQQLLSVYDENAVFSLSTNFGPSSNRQRDKGETMYRKYMRSSKQAPTNIIYPAKAIVQVLKAIPKSLHADRQHWLVDAWQQTTDPPTLFVNVTGVFAEVVDGQYTKRSFDRRFVLLPAGPGSPLPSDQIDGRIVGTSPDASPQMQSAAEMPPMQMPGGLVFQFPPGTTPQQQQMTQEFSAHTRLTLEFAYQCLAGVGFDGTKAVEAFETTKAAGTIPSIAWLPT